MTDEQLHAWWPQLGTLVVELRGIAQAPLADRLVECVQYAATSGEILDKIGVTLRGHRALRAKLAPAGAAAWDAVISDVELAYRGANIGSWLKRWRRKT